MAYAQITLYLNGLPEEDGLRDSILQKFKSMNFIVIYIIIGIKGPKTAVVYLVREIGNTIEITDFIIISSKTVSVNVIPKEFSGVFLFGISDATKLMFYSVTILNHFVMNQTLRNNMMSGLQNIVHDIIHDLECTWNGSDYNIYLFGSRATGFASPNSDCDFFIDVGGMYNGTKAQTRVEQKALVERVYDMLVRYSDIFYNVVQITQCRVPILSFRHVSGISCDLSFKNGLAVENTLLIKRYLDMDPRIKWVINAIKIWIKQNDLIGPTSFKSYALTWMILHVMMKLGVVVPVAELRKMYNGPKKTIADWECGYCDARSIFIKKSLKKMSPQELLQNFFYFYGRKNIQIFKLGVVCPLTGQEVPRVVFEKLSLPPQYYDYVQNFKSYVNTCIAGNYRLDLTTAICVQDPIEMSHNITKNVSSEILQRFTLLCISSAKQLDNRIGKFQNRWKNL